MDWTDSAAVEETRKGNQHAFRVLVERHSGPVFRLTFRMTGNEQDAEDLVQETFLRAYKQIGRFDGRASFGTWLHRIAVNCSLDLLNARKVRRRLEPGTTDTDFSDWLDRVAVDTPSPERLTHSNQIASLLRHALRRLSPPERAAFILRHYEGCNVEEIASALGVRQNAAKQAVFRAVQKLRRALEPVSEVAR